MRKKKKIQSSRSPVMPFAYLMTPKSRVTSVIRDVDLDVNVTVNYVCIEIIFFFSNGPNEFIKKNIIATQNEHCGRHSTEDGIFTTTGRCCFTAVILLTF